MGPEILIIGIVVLIVVGGGAFWFFRMRSDDAMVEERLGRYEQEEIEYQSFMDEKDGAEVEDETTALEDARRFLDPVNAILSDRKFGKTWRRKLARANLKLTVAEFLALHFVGAGGFYFVAQFILQWDIVTAMVAGVIGFFFPRFYVSRLISKRLILFEEQLPDTLGLWVNALRSGYSVLQAMEAIARDAPEPTKTEFHRVVQEVQLGIDLGDALDHLLERVESEDLDLVVTAVNIQREVGGNLAEILETISHTIRERIKLKGEIRVLTSQGRITGYLIGFLPIGLALFLNALNPNYTGLLFSDRQCGWPMLAGGLALIAIGQAVIQKIIDIEM